jgi:hypothetical protein
MAGGAVKLEMAVGLDHLLVVGQGPLVANGAADVTLRLELGDELLDGDGEVS